MSVIFYWGWLNDKGGSSGFLTDYFSCLSWFYILELELISFSSLSIGCYGWSDILFEADI